MHITEPPTPERSPAVAALRARADKGFFLRLGWPPPGWRPYTARASQYRSETMEWLEQAPLPEFASEPLRITIVVNAPNGRQVKPYALVLEAVLDVLTYCRAVRHLSQIAEIRLKRGAPGRPGYLDVWVKPLPPPPCDAQRRGM